MKKLYYLVFFLLIIPTLTFSNDNVRTVQHLSYRQIPKGHLLIDFTDELEYWTGIKYMSYRQFIKKLLVRDLSADIYLPDGGSDQTPLVIMMHGGSFLMGSKKDESVVYLAQRLAELGIAVASIEYRTQALPLLSVSSAGYLAIQDAHSAVKCFRQHADEWNIHPDRIFLGGISAGAVTALHVAWLDQSEYDAAYLARMDDKFGCMRCMEPFDISSEIAGVISINGGIVSTDILKDETVPALLLVGEKDRIIHPEHQRPFEPWIDDLEYEVNQWSLSRALDIPDALISDMYHKLVEGMELPMLYGGKAIARIQDGPAITLKTFEHKGHRLVLSTDHTAMSSTPEVISSIVQFVRDNNASALPLSAHRKKVFLYMGVGFVGLLFLQLLLRRR